MIENQISFALLNSRIITFSLIVTPILSLTNLMIVETNALQNENEIIDEIDKEAERINEIMDQKIKSHPGLGDIYSYCYESVEALEHCQSEVVEEMELYYEDAGKHISDKIESSIP